MKVVGANFGSASTILWNGAAVPTSFIDSGTLSSTISGSSLSSPATAKLQVQNGGSTGGSADVSPPVSVNIVPADTQAPAPLAIAAISLPQGTAGTAYSAGLTANGGTPSYTWSVASGNLPAGLSLSPSGVLSGIPTSSGSYLVTVTATDSSQPAEIALTTLNLSIAPAPLQVPALSFSSTVLPSALSGSVYAASLQAGGGIAPYVWSVSSGSLPSGLSLNGSNGTISGTPTRSGTVTFTATVTDSEIPAQSASTTVTLSVGSQLSIISTSLPSGTSGSSYANSLLVAGGTAPYSWSVTSGNLPAGLVISSGDGLIYGTPTSAGKYTFTATVADSSNPAQTRSVGITLSIASSVPPLTITSTSLSSGNSGSTYSGALQASGGTAPYQWSIASGSLPSGLTLNSGTGVISGTPTTAGINTFRVTVADSSNPAQTQSAAVSLSVAPAPLAITSTSLPSATSATAYSGSLQATGGTSPYIWSVSAASLPAGLTLNSNGVISGTPTAGGGSTFKVTVTDSSSPAQSQSTALTIMVSNSSLVIASSSLPTATNGSKYSSALQATGGTAPYTWSSTSLPAGLSMGRDGTLSGTPTASGADTFTVTVSDSSSPALTQSAKISLVVSPAPLGITTVATSTGTDGTAYSSTAVASGGTPAYTWKISSGSLPAGLTLGASSGIISGTPTATGVSNFTLTVSDNEDPVQTQSASGSITIAAATAATGPGNTWYVRPDGGTRYSSNVPKGECDGLADAPYSGSGTNQHCAFNDVRLLWQDGSYVVDGSSFPSWGWVIAGGDTVIVRGSLGTGVSYRVGWSNNSSCLDQNFTSGAARGICGDAGASGMPPIPSGTAGQHTRILGENYASCHSASAKTQLHGGWGVGNVMSLSGSSYVDVACFDVTDFSACGRFTQSVGCDSTQDWASIGIITSNKSTQDTLTDIHIHGLASSAMAGPTGDGFVADYIDMLGNAGAGWNTDRSDGTTGVGSLNVSHFNISWNGCAEEYPIVDSVPYGDCTDDSSGGYGDGFGTATVPSAAPGWQVHFDQGTVSYNTQDGLDALHISGPGSTMTDTRVLAFGNQGQQLKVGGATATIQNSVIVGNCEAMATQNIPGTPAGFGSKLADSCRAGDTAVVINVTPGDPATFQDNTIYAAGSIGLEVEYATNNTGPTNTLQYNNNIFIGFYNSSAQANATTIYSNTDLNMLTNPGASWTNNATFGQRRNWTCPNPGETKAICSDPGLVDETYHSYGYGNMAPKPGSIVIGAGVAIPGITTDYTGATRSDPPSIGAYE